VLELAALLILDPGSFAIIWVGLTVEGCWIATPIAAFNLGALWFYRLFVIALFAAALAEILAFCSAGFKEDNVYAIF